MIYCYTCTSCGLLVRIGHQASGREVVACMCDAEVTEEVEPE